MATFKLHPKITILISIVTVFLVFSTLNAKNFDKYYKAGNVADYFSNTIELISDIHKRKKIPLLAGGSLMYFHSLYNGLSFLPNKNISDRSLIDHLLKKYSLNNKKGAPLERL